MTAVKKSYYIKSRDFIRAGESSIKIQTLLKSLNFDPKLIRRVAICGYEGEMNVVMHGGDGSMSFAIHPDELILEISDDGPGIADIDHTFADLLDAHARATASNADLDIAVDGHNPLSRFLHDRDMSGATRHFDGTADIF